MKEKPRLLLVAGPTASGKSSYAVERALKEGGEVISVDSRQVYRTLDIGTEKMTAEEMRSVPHHLIDILDPKESYSAGDFVVDARRLIEDIQSRGKLPILAGGTHFYFDALLYGIPEETPIDKELRSALEECSDEELFSEIKDKDPRRADELDPKNRRRLVRALEIIKRFGKVPERQKETSYDIEWVMLLPDREELRDKIVTRLKQALQKGLVEEVRSVREYVSDARLNELGLEYRIVGEYLRGERSEESLLPALSAKLFQYARRQEAWLRKLRDKAGS